LPATAPGGRSASTSRSPRRVPLPCAGGVYAGSFEIGASQHFECEIDTGSSTLAVVGAGCENCAASPIYSPGPTAVDEHKATSTVYGPPAHSWTGEIYQDQVSAGGSPAVPVLFASVTSETDSTELCSTTGTLWLGGYDPAATTGSPEYVSLDTSTGFFGANLLSISVVGVTVPVATDTLPNSIVDTGTARLLLPPTPFNAIVAAIESSPAFLAAGLFGDAGAGSADAGATAWFESTAEECLPVAATEAQVNAAFPPLTLTFGSRPGVEVVVPAVPGYVGYYSSEGQTCYYPLLGSVDPSATPPHSDDSGGVEGLRARAEPRLTRRLPLPP
jgi:hypothetical protein